MKLFYSGKKIKVKTSAVFAILFFVFCIVNIVYPSQGFSANENRNLAQFPNMSVKSIADGTFMKDFDDYTADQFILRDFFASLKAKIQLMTGRKDNNGVYLSDGGYLIAKPEYNKDVLDENICAVKDFTSKGAYNVTLCIIPSAYQALSYKLPKNSADKELIKKLDGIENSFADSYAYTVKLKDIINNYNDNYIYYKTDHHQTALGSFVVYNALANALGYTPFAREDFTEKKVSTDFYGTNWSKFMINGIDGDTITKFTLKGGNADCTVEFPNENTGGNSLYFKENLNKKDKYTYYLDGNHPLAVVNTSCKNGKSIAVIGDSYTHSIVPFLANHYETIHIIDMRYYSGDVIEYMFRSKLTNVLMLYGASSFASDASVSKIGVLSKSSPYANMCYGYVEYSEPVDNSYFNDAVFVGDSLTEQFRMYSGIDRGIFCARVGASFYNIEKNTTQDGTDIYSVIKNYPMNKMYIMLGINQELNGEFLPRYINSYSAFIDTVRESHPDIVIYIQSVLPLDYERSQKFNISNADIAEANKALNKLAIDKNCFYVALDEIVCDEYGNLKDGISADGMHLNADYCVKWLDYLKTHTVNIAGSEEVKSTKNVSSFSGNGECLTDEYAQKIIEKLKFSDNLTKVNQNLLEGLYSVKCKDLADASVYMSSGATAEEVAVFEVDVKGGTDIQTLKEKLQKHVGKRKTSFENYLPNETEKLKNPVIYAKGNTVVLCVSNNPKHALKVIESVVK